jgi:hypothetical protein
MLAPQTMLRAPMPISKSGEAETPCFVYHKATDAIQPPEYGGVLFLKTTKMKETPKRDITMNDSLPEFSLTFKRPFRFESNNSLEDVTQALKMLARHDPFDSEPVNATFSSIPHGCSFHYEIRRLDKNSRACTTAVGNGKIWQRANGIVVVQGTAHIDPMGFYGALIVSALLCLTTAISMTEYAVLFGLLFIGLAFLIALFYFGDRNRMITLISNRLAPENL